MRAALASGPGQQAALEAGRHGGGAVVDAELGVDVQQVGLDRGFDEAFDALLLRYINERPIDDVASRPEGSVPVSFTLFTVPGSEPPEGGG